MQYNAEQHMLGHCGSSGRAVAAVPFPLQPHQVSGAACMHCAGLFPSECVPYTPLKLCLSMSLMRAHRCAVYKCVPRLPYYSKVACTMHGFYSLHLSLVSQWSPPQSCQPMEPSSPASFLCR